MKIKFKSQPYQAHAVDAVVDCFDGQPRQDALRYTIDPGAGPQARMEIAGFGNTEFALNKAFTPVLRAHSVGAVGFSGWIARR